MTSLSIAPGLSLPLDIAGQATVILGLRGSGKTNTAGALAEELLDHGQPIAVIDPTDAWWGLRAGKDGSQSGGYQVFIFGGSHADIPLQETDGKIVAEFLVRERVSVILSLRHLRKAAQRRFVTEFCEELYHLKGKPENRMPLTVFIDEAPLFVPQKVMGEVARTVGAVEDLIARGRNAGFGVVLISQRSATLNADVRTQADTMICHRVTAALDRRAIEGWFEENASVDDLKAILKSLATLKNGEGWIWAPSLDIIRRVQMRMRRTFDSSATPKMGHAAAPPKRLADIDLSKLQQKMVAAAEERKANDPAQLRATIEAQRRELATVKAAPAPNKAADPEAITRAVEKAVNSAKKEMGRKVSAAFGPLVKAARAFSDKCGSLIPAEAEWTFEDVTLVIAAPERTIVPRAPVVPRPTPTAATSGFGVPMAKAERKVLTVLAQYPAGRTKTQVAILTGYAHSGGGFNNALSALRSKGFIEGSDPLSATDAGIDALGSFEPLPTGKELADHWLRQLGKAERTVLVALIDSYPDAISKELLADACGYAANGGGFNNALSRLRSLELIGGRAELRASEALFG